MEKINRNSGNKTQKIYGCRTNDALSKLIVDNGLKDIWRRENQDSSVFTRYNRSSDTRSRIDRAYTNMKIVNNTKINHIKLSFTDYYNATSIERLPSKNKIGKDSCYFNKSLLWRPEFSSTTKILLFFY